MAKNRIQSILAIGITVFVLTYMLFVTFMEVPKNNQSYVQFAIGWLSGVGTMVFGYYFGNSKKPDEVAKESILIQKTEASNENT